MDADERRILDEIAKMRDLLRAAIRRAIEDPEFRAIFTDDDALEKRWPAPRRRVGFWGRLRQQFPS